MIGVGVAAGIAAGCLAAEAFFAGSEMALVSADRGLLRRKAAAGETGARLALDFLERRQRLLATTLLGTSVSVVVATIVVTCALLERTAAYGQLWAVALLVPPFVLLARLLPRALGIRHANALATVVVYPLRGVSLLLAPAVWIVGRVTAWAARLLHVEERRALVTRDELRLLLDDPEGSVSAIPDRKREMISNVLELNDTSVYDIMVPLSEVTALPADASLDEAAAEIADKQHTRIPIYQDRIDQIVGMLFSFDVLKAEAAGKKGTVADFARPPIFVPENKPSADLLVELQRAGEQLAVVVDEYGGAVGVCAIEDILEEIVGEIDDEYDRAPSTIRPEGPGLRRVQARTPLAQVNETLQIALPDGEDYESLAGLLLDRLKRIPREGETIRIGEVTLTILAASDRAIEEVRIRVARRK